MRGDVGKLLQLVVGSYQLLCLARHILMRITQPRFGRSSQSDVLANAAIAREIALFIEYRLSADTEVMKLAALVHARALEIMKCLVRIENRFVIHPVALGQPGHVGVPAPLADKTLRRDSGPVLDTARNLREAQILVLLPIPVG